MKNVFKNIFGKSKQEIDKPIEDITEQENSLSKE